MADIPGGLRYTADHEYAKPTDEPGVLLIGITDFAQGELGDVVFVDLTTKAGATLAAHEVFGAVEAVKTVGTLYCPVAGTVLELNPAVAGDPAVVNRDPYGEGWMIRLRATNPSDVDALLSAEAYRAHVGG